MSLPAQIQILKIKRLEQTYERLSKEWEWRDKVIAELNRSLTLKTEPITRLRWQQELDEHQEQHKLLEQELKQIEEQLSSDNQSNGNGHSISSLPLNLVTNSTDKDRQEQINIFLLYLDFIQQTGVFRRFISNNKIAAFLVHGAMGYGHIWLLKRLFVMIPNSSVTPPIQISLGSGAVPSRIENLWRQLAQAVGLPGKPLPEAIGKSVFKRLQKQNVIIVLHGIERMYETYLNDLIVQFWKPLVSAITAQGSSYDNKLLMFLVDYDGCVDGWQSITCVENFDEHWQPYTLVKLDKIQPLSLELLTNFFEMYIDILAPGTVKLPSELGKSTWEKARKGVPGEVLEQVYTLCGYDFYEEGKLWQEL